MSGVGQRTAVAVVGCGYWGKNIVRNFAELGMLAAVCDEDRERASEFADRFNVPAKAFDAILSDRSCDAVALATPAALHAQHVLAAINAGKHVFVEKPLALSVAEGRSLAHAAAAAKRTLMVGHLLHYHPVFLALLALVRDGRLGRIHHVFSNRLNFGKVRTEEDIIWSFAPHDISMVLALFGEEPNDVRVEATAILDQAIADVADLHLRFPGGGTARVSVSWLNPYKEQKLVVVGSHGHAVFDDTLSWPDKLMLYGHRVDYGSGRPLAVPAKGTRVTVEQREPLREECAHFEQCIQSGAAPRTDAAEALRVLAILEMASQQILKRN